MIKHYLNISILIINIFIGFVFFSFKGFIIYSFISLAFFFIVLGLGILFLKLNYFISAKCSTNNKICLLTFDDGPSISETPKILSILNQYNIKAIFFVIGKKLDESSEVIKRCVNEGHLIGNHTYNHDIFLALKSSKHIKKEIELCDEKINKIIGKKVEFFRPPIGYTTPNYYRALKNKSKKVIGWDLRSYDSIYKDRNKLIDRLVQNIKPNSIILFHDNLPITADILEDFIIKAKNKGIIFADKTTIHNIL